MNYKQIIKTNEYYRDLLLSLFPYLKNADTHGIYMYLRQENNFKYAYVGQSKNVLNRLIQHARGYKQHIDLSLRNHGYITEKNQTGWKITWQYYKEKELDEAEQFHILDYAKNGYQLLNATSGSQGKGKKSITQTEIGGYNKGKAVGYKKAMTEIGEIIRKYSTGLHPKDGATAERKIKELERVLFGIEN